MPLILLKHFNFSPEAELTKSHLETEGIKTIIQKEGVPGASVTLMQGADLFVEEKDFAKASEIVLCSQS